MNKKIITVLTISLLSISAIGFANASSVKQEIPLEKKVKLEKNLKEFRDKVNDDIASSFNIELSGYKQLDRAALFQDKSGELDALKNAFMEVIENQEEGDIMPNIFINEETNEGLILEKKSDGKNKIYKLEKGNSKNLSKHTNHDDWKIVDEDETEGEIILFEEVD
ncbi:hypothetical protein [Brevibacillus borstelensis]|uniref:hypothetical protein n=1 Tax=Brevibacillus borstelensis TaxID=45462 RepID=UPI0030BF7CA3